MKIYRTMALWVCLSFLGVPPAFSAAFPPVVDLKDTYTGIVKIDGSDTYGILGLWSAAGDINGDGIDDAVVCAQRNNPNGRDQAGEVFVFFGSGSFFDRKQVDLATDGSMLTILGVRMTDNTGASAALGDLNHDGLADILIGAPGDSKACIIFGSPGLASQKTIDLATAKEGVVWIYGFGANEEFGHSVFTADVNGDGYEDAIIGAPAASPFRKHEAGEVFVIYGKQDWSTQKDLYLRETLQGYTRIIGGGEGDWLGVRAVGGDLNGDGFDDVIIGAFAADYGNASNCGKTYVVFGSSGMPQSPLINLDTASSGVLAIMGENTDDFSGLCLSPVDVDGDPYGDILVSGSGYDYAGRSGCGVIYVIRGASDLASRKAMNLGTADPNVIRIHGEQQDSYLSRGFTTDINRDGRQDLLVTATEADPLGRDRAGKAWLLYGPLTGLGNAIDLAAPPSGTISFLGGQAEDYLGGFCVTGDFDHDGFPDMVIGSHAASPYGRTQAGKCYIISGKGIEKTTDIPEIPFVFAENTGAKASVYIDSDRPPLIDGKPIQIGDAIGVFTPAGVCAGAASWTGEDLIIPVWGDNPEEEGMNGFQEGERFYFRLWDQSEAVVLLASATFTAGTDTFNAGGVSVIGNLAAGIVSGLSAQKPAGFSLSQNYPNPFNQSTVIHFSVPSRERVTMKIYNSLGEEVATLVQGTIDPGTYDITWDGAGMASGQYLCRLQAGTSVETRKLILMK